jgi:type II secretory pathway pseudopilin PulG
MEIALLVIGVIIFIISFVMPEVPMKKSDKEIAAEKEEARRLVEQEVDTMRLRVGEATNETVGFAVDKAERSLEKVSNEKIMAVGEYAETVLEEINKNHQEVMFLYDMLKDKQTDLNNTIREADAAVKEIENASHSAMDASETLLRGMSVASVSQKGLTNEQKSVFDIEIPDAPPVVFEHEEKKRKEDTPKKGVALTQSKIEAQLLGIDKPDDALVKAITADAPANVKEKVVYDILSGGAYKEGNIVNVESPSQGAATAADFEAMSGDITEAPANNNDKILSMAKQGFDTVQIAKTLGLGVGEVKLVLDLFR